MSQAGGSKESGGKRPSRQIPVVVITGYLGAGKTTFLNHLLALESFREQDIALVINEFGPMGVDGALVEAGTRPVHEINKGSLFCACTKMQLMQAMEKIIDAGPERVVIEATGLAVPAEFTGLVDSPFLADSFRVEYVVCLVDAKNFLRVAPYLQAARRQVVAADGVVLNKADAVDERTLSDIRTVVGDLNPSAPALVTSRGQVGAEWLGSLTHRNKEEAPAQAPPLAIFAASIEVDAALDRNRFDALLETLGQRVLRLKGTVDFGQGVRFVEKVGEDLSVTGLQPRKPLSGKGRTAFTVIAREIPEAELRESFLSLVLPVGE
jgi:G3E family GTPase